MGDVNGLFIVVPRGRVWFPTADVHGATEPGEVELADPGPWVACPRSGSPSGDGSPASWSTVVPRPGRRRRARTRRPPVAAHVRRGDSSPATAANAMRGPVLTRGAPAKRGAPVYTSATTRCGARRARAASMADVRPPCAGRRAPASRWSRAPAATRTLATRPPGAACSSTCAASARSPCAARAARWSWAQAPAHRRLLEARRSGCTIPAGSCPNVGIAGLAQGGGHGLASRQLGLTCDNVVALTVVTADGRLRTVDANHDPDLFWALRGGGGGQFGIVTSLTLKVTPVRSAAYFFASWPSPGCDRHRRWQDFAPDAPNALMSILTLATGGSQPTVRALGQYMGPESALASVLRPLRASGATITTGSSPYGQLVLRWAGCLDIGVQRCHITPAGSLQRALRREVAVRRPQPVGRRHQGAHQLHPATTGDDGRRLGRAAAGRLRRCDQGGRPARPRSPTAPSASRSRSSPTGATTRRRRCSGWLDARGHGAFASGQAYQNYVDPELTSWRQAWFGSNLARLQAVKREYDPDRLFRFRQGL